MDDNKRNLLYFEGSSMRKLYSEMENWQAQHRKRILSLSIHPDGDSFCCIAATSPTEVMIVDGGSDGAFVKDHRFGVNVDAI